tara:strand:+ start:244 stop:696 length:453 start_codon:yes stop_codon:yes gene_type:complete
MEVGGYENYLIYEDGRVQNNKTKRYLKQYDNGRGYYQVNLCKEGKGKLHKIHRLVGLHYLANPDNKICLDHINRNSGDNRLENLRWATHSENQQNTGVRKDNTSGIKNISYSKSRDNYVYQKIIRGVRHEKSFKTLEEAIEYKNQYECSI